MPIHDWTRVCANQFHDFHQKWTVSICNALNAGPLPAGYFAMVEQHMGPEAHVVTLELTGTEAANYARKANRVTVRHPDGDVVAIVEVVSPGNKDSQHAIRTFARKAAALLQAGVHLLIVDLFPPSRRDPQGIHKVIWDRLRNEPFELPASKPLTLAAYTAGTEIVAYVEPAAVGDSLIDMPIFISEDRYVQCPLEATYQTAWEQFPAPLKAALEAPETPRDH